MDSFVSNVNANTLNNAAAAKQGLGQAGADLKQTGSATRLEKAPAYSVLCALTSGNPATVR
jgi:hypothetical protein